MNFHYFGDAFELAIFSFVCSKKLCDDFVYSGVNHGGGLKSADAECVPYKLPESVPYVVCYIIYAVLAH